MKPRRILIIVPYRARDLEGNALIGHYLEKRYGHEVIYNNGYGIERRLRELAPDAIAFDHLEWNFKGEQARLAKSLGTKVFVIPTEGLFHDEELAARTTGKLNGVTHLVDGYFSWGTYLQDAVVKQKLMTPEQIPVTGCPRFDFYAEPFTRLMTPREEFARRWKLRDASAPIIVWATNTPYQARDPKKIVYRLVKKAGWTEERALKCLDDEREQFRQHSNAIMTLARRHPEMSFLIKIHPAEPTVDYLEMERAQPNVHLAFDAPIRDFLYHADVLLQRNCTTATESAMLNKPAIQMEFGSYHVQASEMYRTTCHNVGSLEELDEVLVGYVNGAAIPAELRQGREAFISRYYHRIDGRASERIADEMHARLTGSAYTDDDQQRTRETAARALADWQAAEDRRLVNKLKSLIGVDRNTSIRFWKPLFSRERRLLKAQAHVAEAQIDRADVEAIYARYDAILGDLRPLAAAR